jgi:hypothetical protein
MTPGTYTTAIGPTAIKLQNGLIAGKGERSKRRILTA